MRSDDGEDLFDYTLPHLCALYNAPNVASWLVEQGVSLDVRVWVGGVALETCFEDAEDDERTMHLVDRRVSPLLLATLRHGHHSWIARVFRERTSVLRMAWAALSRM